MNEDKNIMTLDTGENKKKCAKCGKIKKIEQFYRYRDGSYMEMCKECVTLHVNNFDPDSFTWILEKLDLPYVPSEWNVLRDREYARNPDKVGGVTVIGKYIGKMKLKQFADKRWADSEALVDEQAAKDAAKSQQKQAYQDMMKARYEAGEISEQQYRTIVDTNAQYEKDMEDMRQAPSRYAEALIGSDNMYKEDNYLKESDLPDPAASLTAEDKIYLVLKWGRLYKPNELMELERQYNEMMKAFDIQDPDTKNSVLLICKTYLKMNQALDEGDIEGYQKLARVHESMRKTAKLTAAQNKEDHSKEIDCIGELVAMCEKEEGFIPRFNTEYPLDKVDKTLINMNEYTHNLVMNDLGLGDQIEQQLKKMQIQQELDAREESGDDDHVLSDDEIAEYYDDIDEQIEADAAEKITSGIDEDALDDAEDDE